MTGPAQHRVLLVALLLAVGCSAAGAGTDVAGALHEADQANMANDLARERKVLERAEGGEGDPEDLAEVQRRLALIEWRYERKDDRARKRLQRAVKGAEPALAWLALARLEQERERFDAAELAAGKALDVAAKQMERRDASLAWANAVVERSITSRRRDESGVDTRLRTAHAQLEEELRAEVGQQQQSMLLLHASLLLDDGEAAGFAFRSYYQMPAGSAAPTAFPDAAHELLRRLGEWNGTEAGTADRVALAKALDGTRLFVAAAIVAQDPRAEQEVRDALAVRETLAYLDFTDRLRDKLEEHYRDCLHGDCNGSRQKRDRKAELARFVEELKRGGEKPFRGDVLDYIERRFGGHVNVGYTAGSPDTHYGHSVLDERRSVEQYGHRADVRYVSLDHMVSNGFQSWAWENKMQHGGWASSTAIYQIRSAYLGELMEMGRAIEDGEERREFEKQMREESERDVARAAADPHAYLPGLKKRLQWQALSQLLDRVRAGLGEGDALGADPDGPTWRLEYQAKLSEVAFAPVPRIAVAGMLSANIGDASPHGVANLKVVKNLVAWMKSNREAIAGLDADRPLLPQLDLLTDEQFRAAFREMDPLAKKRG